MSPRRRHVGPELGVQILGESTGVSASFGYGLPIDHQNKGFTFASVTGLLY